MPILGKFNRKETKNGIGNISETKNSIPNISQKMVPHTNNPIAYEIETGGFQVQD